MDYLQNIKMWCRNNLGMVGKWGGASNRAKPSRNRTKSSSGPCGHGLYGYFLFGVAITAFMFGGNLPLHAYVLDATPTSSSQPIELKLDFNSTEILRGGFRLNQGINIGTGIPLNPTKNTSQNMDFSKFFSSSTVSSNDITSFLKEAAVTSINLTILVISITTQILKGLLSVLK